MGRHRCGQDEAVRLHAFPPRPRSRGGHCIPFDTFYLSWKAAEYGVWPRFIELAGEINTSMPRYVVQKAVDTLNEQGKSIKGARVCVLGLSYKADIDDDRESPSFELIELLRDRGAVDSYCDPYIPVARSGRKHDIGLKSIPCTAEALGEHDALLISTAHKAFSDASLCAYAKLVIDTPNVASSVPAIAVKA